MRISASKLKKLWEEDPDKMAHILAESLRDAKYKVTDASVKSQITDLYAGEEPRTVTSMFLNEWLTKGIE